MTTRPRIVSIGPILSMDRGQVLTQFYLVEFAFLLITDMEFAAM
jgi:hypothetical protein